jgi:hypothetical protein
MPVRCGPGLIIMKTSPLVGQLSPTGSRVTPRASPSTAARRSDPPPLSPLHSGASLPHTPRPVDAPHFGESRHGGILLRARQATPRHAYCAGRAWYAVSALWR